MYNYRKYGSNYNCKCGENAILGNLNFQNEYERTFYQHFKFTACLKWGSENENVPI